MIEAGKSYEAEELAKRVDGGAMLDMLTHMLDLAIFYFGKPV